MFGASPTMAQMSPVVPPPTPQQVAAAEAELFQALTEMGSTPQVSASGAFDNSTAVNQTRTDREMILSFMGQTNAQVEALKNRIMAMEMSIANTQAVVQALGAGKVTGF